MKLQVAETITIAQAKNALRQTAALYFSKDRAGRYRMDRRRARPVCLMGPAGLGKTEIVRQVAEEQGLALLSYSVTHHTRQSAIGLPRLIEREIGGRRVSMTEYTMSEIIAEVYRVMQESGRTEGILFLDEFNCASETLRPVMLQLLQAKTFGPHAIPEGWMLVLAGNPPEYNAAAGALDAVTADRLRLLHLRPDYPAWRSYMTRRGVHPIVLSYLDDHKSHFYQFERGADGTALVTARGWEDLSVLLRLMEEQDYPVDLPFVAQFLQSAAVAREFYVYYQQYAALIASGLADEILYGEPTEELADRVEALSFPERWALTSLLLFRLEGLCGREEPKTQQQALEAMERALSFYAAVFVDEPQYEYFVNGITNSDALAATIARLGSEGYRSAAGRGFFNEDAPGAADLKQLLGV